MSNICVWLLLSLATCSFVRMLNKRFGEAEFSGPKCKLYIFLSVFSLSFFVRGTWDLYLYYSPNDIGSNQQDYAATVFLVYFLTECCPICCIYLNHLMAFYGIIKRQRQRLLSEMTNMAATTAGAQSLITTAEVNLQELTKRDEFAMLIANVPRSPACSGKEPRSRSAIAPEVVN